MTPVRAATTVYESALRGRSCVVVDPDGALRRLPVEDWRRTATNADRRILEACAGTTLDIGCGPGRMAEALTDMGRHVLGIDIVDEAVRQAQARGVAALRRDVFAPIPAEGSWDSVLVADGNIGIGGDPQRLLDRVTGLVRLGGTVVVDLDPPGAGVRHTTLRIATDEARSREFRWAIVGADAWTGLARRAGLAMASVQTDHDRWYGVARRSA
ncbi:methyltransferase domain-containing protein [Marmoricola sp. RAF53]|uniref:methyltransferase domain-containing protein n=1 Tax=Marmoricola sp. RAF53 TaxID=3233059 RepID=UPI003F9D7C61